MPTMRIAGLPPIALALLLAGCGGDSGGPEPPAAPAPADSAVVLNEDFGDRALFPADNWWNLDLTAAPVDPASDAFIAWLSGRVDGNTTAVRRLHPDFGPSPYGIPFVGVSGTQSLTPVTWTAYGDESDDGAPGRPPGYPIPAQARAVAGLIEGGVAGGGDAGDRHLIIVDRDHRLLFETWATSWNVEAGRWEAGSGAVFDLATNARRPDGWTSADAAGLAILPGLVKYDEAARDAPIAHAFRFTARATNGCVWPASHGAGSTVGALPMGARLRLKASVDLTAHPPLVQRILRAMQTHGLILADNGSDLYIQGTMDARWDNDLLNPAFAGLTADDFEVVQLGWGEPGR